MRMALLMLGVMVVGGGCATTTLNEAGGVSRVPIPKVAQPGATILRVTRHWATCEPGPVVPVTLAVGRADGSGVVVLTERLQPGEVRDVPIAPGAWWHRVSDDSGAILEEAAIEAAGGSAVIAVSVGCAPHTLRSERMAAVVLVAARAPGEACKEGEACAAVFAGEVRLGGVAVSLSALTPQTMRLPRGTHTLTVRRADGSSFMDASGCAGALTSVTLDGAGAVVYVNRCGVVRQEPL